MWYFSGFLLFLLDLRLDCNHFFHLVIQVSTLQIAASRESIDKFLSRNSISRKATDPHSKNLQAMLVGEKLKC